MDKIHTSTAIPTIEKKEKPPLKEEPREKSFSDVLYKYAGPAIGMSYLLDHLAEWLGGYARALVFLLSVWAGIIMLSKTIKKIRHYDLMEWWKAWIVAILCVLYTALIIGIVTLDCMSLTKG